MGFLRLPCIPDCTVGNWEFRFLRREETQNTKRKKLLEQRNNIYNLNPRMTSLPVFEPRPHCWEASAVITLGQLCFPWLLELRTNQCVQLYSCVWSWVRGWTCRFWHYRNAPIEKRRPWKVGYPLGFASKNEVSKTTVVFGLLWTS